MLHSKPLVRGLLVIFLLAGWLAGILMPTLAPVKAAPQKASSLDVIINEIAWAGTPKNPNAEWIELYNSTSSNINLTGWTLSSITDASPTIALSGTIIAGGYYLLERTDDTTISDISADQIYTGSLSNNGEALELRDSSSNLIDTANQSGGSWPAGLSSNYSSMERNGVTPDSPTAWVTNIGVVRNGVDSGGNPINGTPKQANWALTVTVTPSPTATFTPTSTNTPTATFTPGSTTPTPTSTTALPLSIIINEVAWAGTAANSNDEWIELYNPGLNTVNLNGWHLFILDLNRNIVQDILLTGSIPAGGYYLLARSSSNTPTPPACVVFNSADVTIDKTFTASLSNSGAILELKDPPGNLVDTANSDGGSWPAGLSFNYSSMERRGTVLDSSTAWFTFAGSTASTARDCVGNRVRGTPKGSNWAWTVTITPTPRPPKTATPRPPTPFGRMVINEFLPRAGFDWNNDGVIDVNDEFIEIENLGPVDVNLSGWKLDDEINTGSSPYTLPNKILKTGERAVFYGSMTNILLNDSGDSVRLINKSGVVVDARTYGVVKYPDQSHCRIPDGNGYWQLACFPTPGNENALAGVLPAPPPDKANQPAACLLPDTTPEEFRLAECAPFGADIWNRKYWDDAAGQNQFIVPDSFSKSQTIVE